MKTLNEIMAENHRIEDLLIESSGEITEEIQALMDSHETNFNAKVDRYAGFIAHIKAQSATIDERIKSLQARKKTNATIIDNMRERLLYAMESEGRDKIRTVEHTATVKTIQSITLDVEAIPEALYGDLTANGWLTYERKFDKTEIKKNYSEENFVLTEEKKTLALR